MTTPSWSEYRWTSGGYTDVGTVRKVNEDDLFMADETGLWAVADGMGGHAAGDVASKFIVKYLAQVSHPETLGEFIDEVDERLIAVNERLLKLSEAELQGQTVGSTVVALLAHKQYCAFLWVGDSRLYRLREGRLEMVIQEHTQAEELIEKGLLTREQAEDHPSFQILTRAVGAQTPLITDVDVALAQPDDVYLLCSDGLNKGLTDDQIRDLIDGEALEQSAKQLVGAALDAGSRDNVTVVLVKCSRA